MDGKFIRFHSCDIIHLKNSPFQDNVKQCVRTDKRVKFDCFQLTFLADGELFQRPETYPRKVILCLDNHLSFRLLSYNKHRSLGFYFSVKVQKKQAN